MQKVPYGISNFEMLISEGYLYVDRTAYLELLENMSYRYLFFLRPRKFGKSLFLSVLEYYYDVNLKAKFESLFGQFYIGQHPTPKASQYLILQFDFSQIDTSSYDRTLDGFLNNIKVGVSSFYGRYAQFFSPENIKRIRRYDFPSKIIQDVIEQVALCAPDHKIYLLIDEYDHFANEILSFRYDEFMTMVGRNGFVRKFYEAIKVGTQKGVIDRMFVTGVSPITLDSLTSGFNIASSVTLNLQLDKMMGFTEEEVIDILKKVGVTEADLADVLADMRSWYNGYKFNEDSQIKIYNPNMVLYFAAHYNDLQQYPRELLDPNIASDYTKIRSSFKIQGREKEHLAHLETLLETGQLKAKLTGQYNLDKRFDNNDFISLLFYQGITTITDNIVGKTVFQIPNFVIRELYYQYFYQVILERSQLTQIKMEVDSGVEVLALEGDISSLVAYTEKVLQELAVRDALRFNEKYIKVIFTAAIAASGIYYLHNEFEVKVPLKSGHTGKGFVDLLLLERPPYKLNCQVVLELKYLQQKDSHRLESVKQEAVEQLQNYLQQDEFLNGLEKLKAFVIVFAGFKGEIVEIGV
ncbi:MAG: AAA family ATPase [Bacteroidota bacterium]